MRMSIKVWTTLLLAIGSSVAGAVDYSNSQLSILRPGGDRPCTLFQLVGVTQADPAAPYVWFAVPDTLPDYSALVAGLFLAKATGSGIDVSTTGAVSTTCGGYAIISAVLIH
jgi:hypothetical protein